LTGGFGPSVGLTLAFTGKDVDTSLSTRCSKI
jgi:hypothetical protein